MLSFILRGGVVRHAAGRSGGYPDLQGSSGEPAPRQPAGVRFSGPRILSCAISRAEHDRQPCPATGTGIAVLTRTDRALFMRGGVDRHALNRDTADGESRGYPSDAPHNRFTWVTVARNADSR